MTDLKWIRTDVVGSLLRPPELKEARTAFDEGRIDAEEFRAVEDARSPQRYGCRRAPAST